MSERVENMWVLVAILLAIWFIPWFFFGKGGFIHILLLTAISIFVVQFIAYRKTQYERNSSNR